MIVQHQLLLWNVEPFLIDSDIVLFKDPKPLFEDPVDFTVTEVGNTFTFGPNYHYRGFNIGFMRIQPNYRTLYIFRLWIIKILRSSTYTQSLLHSIIKPHRIINNFTIGKQIQFYSFKSLETPLSVKIIHPLDFPNGIMIRHKNRLLSEITKSNRSIPYGAHFAWEAGSANKENALELNNLWFFDRSNQNCFSTPPKGSSLNNW